MRCRKLARALRDAVLSRSGLRTGMATAALLALLALVPLARGTAADASPLQGHTRGGTTTWHLNQAVLDPLHVRIGMVADALPVTQSTKHSSYRELVFAVRTDEGLTVSVAQGLPRALLGGAMVHAGGFTLDFPGGSADLHGFALRPRTDAPFALDLVDADGHAWFTLDHGHYLLEDDNRTLALRYMNLRVSSYFAQRLGQAQLAGRVVGGMDTLSALASILGEKPVGNAVASVCTAPWPGQAGAHADIKMMYQSVDAESGVPDGIHVMRCGVANGSGGYTVNACTPASTDHVVVLAPDTSLMNVGTTAVPWHKMFTGPYAPYGNDQHPFLVWNLYRVEADGALRQLGASGVKHAFNTINKVCGCSDSQNNYPTCEDSYSNYSNDIAATVTPNYLGPRSEVIPATGQWGRCGSVFDSACTGTMDADGGAQDDFQYRLVVPESDLVTAGASYFFEYSYVVRDQANIYDAMGYRPVSFAKNSQNGLWTATPGTFANGPFINAWVSPTAAPSGAANTELATVEGHARIALTTTALGGGKYRYNYAVMNLDFARAVIDPAHASEPNLHVLSSDGFSTFALPVSSAAALSDFVFSDLDDNAGNDWTVTRSGGSLQWQASPGHPLNWSSLYRFSFTADRAPLPGNAQLGVAGAGSPDHYLGTVLAPLDNVIFQDGFGAP